MTMGFPVAAWDSGPPPVDPATAAVPPPVTFEPMTDLVILQGFTLAPAAPDLTPFVQPVNVPGPGAAPLMVLGLVALIGRRRRSQASRAGHRHES